MTNDEAMELLHRIDAFFRQCSPHHRARDWHKLLTKCRDFLAAQEPKAAPQIDCELASIRPTGNREYAGAPSASAAPASGMPEGPTRFIPVWRKKFMAADRDGRFVLAEDYDTLRSAYLSLRGREGRGPRSTLEKADEVIRIW